MREIATFFGGVGLLIFAYLLLANYVAVPSIFGSISNLFVSGVSVLQGRGGTGSSSSPFNINLPGGGFFPVGV
jgi:hypothetical protein